MSDRKERRGLGRGLSALMADVAVESGASGGERAPASPDLRVPVEKIVPNPAQPRRHFSPEALEELASSIRSKGIIQPLIVRQMPDQPDIYQIVAGERRWRAAQMARLHEVPVLVRTFSDSEVLEIAIIENIQRADLNPIDEAQGYHQLMERFGHTQQKLAEALGKSRSHIANLMRLLQLPEEVQTYLRDGQLSAGHARALITSDDPASLARQVISRGLSVRQAESLARKGPAAARPRRGRLYEKDADTRVLEQDLSATLGMSVVIEHSEINGEGQVIIRYKTIEALDQLCQLLSQNR
ncbi:ParB/RepB/Spo0J family partition protein [Alkalilacustris brevis]|uniref:ParB/RepB/Spo0J family partition protein n=1 Tax=Alkalilacustris brevis TaxID=2026338 RepID=UPI000E0DAB5D|nr:ParB/RepB/Spo0J family partition protein [Alkalilacustris brevis]